MYPPIFPGRLGLARYIQSNSRSQYIPATYLGISEAQMVVQFMLSTVVPVGSIYPMNTLSRHLPVNGMMRGALQILDNIPKVHSMLLD